MHRSDRFNRFSKKAVGKNCDLEIHDFESLCENMEKYIKVRVEKYFIK